MFVYHLEQNSGLSMKKFDIPEADSKKTKF